MDKSIKLPEGNTAIIGTMMRHRKVAVTVQYDGPGGRLSRSFATAPQARKFYLRQAELGKNPSIEASNL